MIPSLAITPSARLAELSVENLVLVEQVRLEIGPGLVVLTGETGVGKSILVDAMRLLSGARGSAGLIRSGTERAVVEGVFQGLSQPLQTRLHDVGVETDTPGELRVRRVLQRSGGSAAYLNDRRVGLPLLAEVMTELVDVQGQHAQRSLLAESAHGALLDAMGGLQGELAHYRQCYNGLKSLQKQIDAARAGRAEAQARAAFLRFAVDEIDAAGIDPDADAELDGELARLANAECLKQLSGTAYRALYGADNALLSGLSRVRQQLAEMAAMGVDLTAPAQLLGDAEVQLEEAADALRLFRDGTRPDPARQAEVEARMGLIEALKCKYGDTLDAILRCAEQYRAELAQSGDVAGHLAELEQRFTDQRIELAERARRLTQGRAKAAKALAVASHSLLAKLAMPHARLSVESLPCTDGFRHEETVLGPEGAERPRFVLAANPGEAAGPLAKVASGGELSRIMLALKLALIDADPVPCLIFDEVDTGIGGAVAEQVGRMLKTLSAGHQVFCVTHLAQIASLADQHLLVAKASHGGRTRTRVNALSPEHRVTEVARMLGGVELTDTTLAHARELLGHGATHTAQAG